MSADKNNEMSESIKNEIEFFIKTFNAMHAEIGKFIVGHEKIIEQVLTAIVCGGHVLLEGLPGLGKTALVHTVSNVLHLDFKRIQFTPDLLPADILGTNILVEDENGRKQFEFQKGPAF